ncbi:hypothetical protein [Halovivax cerinus]|uniref:DUF8151 domain-containing protein n=1 Tax=Halovivax cerinus TaxID=1487865 RepID=A0ABD5NS33_9EURY|nr:hypothetical protein [Halovivax cerinus]
MTLIGSELLVEIVSLAVYAVLAVVFTVVGVLAESASLQHLGGNDLFLAGWLAAIGFVMLYAGIYAVGYRKLVMHANEVLAA